MRLEQGQILDGRYTLDRRLGSGGMADVWAAQDLELGREVAIKVLHENFARDAEFVERFRREASAAAALQHPNVVAVFDRGELPDSYYIAMEYVDGSSLKELIGRGLEISESVEVTRQILSAVEFAHERGIIHRDLKPLNVLIDRSGRVRVTDFGIARAVDSEITQTGSVMGTAEYLSPEQAQGLEVSPATDVYAVGVMLFEMLTGRVPFAGGSAVAVAMKQVSEDPVPPSSINPYVSPALDSVVMRALAKEPGNRYGSAAEMLAALEAAEASPELPGHTERYAAYAPSRRWWWIAAIVLLLLAGGALAYALTRSDDVKVPNVTGQDVTDATLELQSDGFEVQINRVANALDKDTVIEQDPRGGKQAKEGSDVTLEVSLGPAPVQVRDVSGLTESKARRQLENDGFSVASEQRFDEAVEAGLVIETNPAAETELAAGETVTLIVSEGTESVEIPDVVGLDRFQAKSTLQDAGFEVDQDEQNADEPEDQVIRQLPDALSQRPAGSTVTIVYSNGAGTIVLEDFVGETQSFAERRLAKQELAARVRTESVDDDSEDGIVQSQTPDPGTRLSPGDRVTIVVGEFTPAGGSEESG